MTSRGISWLQSKARLYVPGGTLRIRLTLLYGGLFLLCGTVLSSATYVIFKRAIDVTQGKGPPVQYPVRHIHDPALMKGAQQSATADLHQLLISSAIALAILTVVALLLGWFLAGRMLRPLRTITATARRISAGNLHERLNLSGPKDELRELGDTFDELLGRLERSWDSQRQFVSNVSHELRSPVTRLRLQAEIAATDGDATVQSLQAGYQSVIDAAQQQEELIAALLSLAKGQRGLHHQENFDLSRTARDVVNSLGPQAEQRALRFDVDIKPAVISGDPQLIEQLIRNLLDNAILYNVAGGGIHLCTLTNEERSVLSVSNDGPNIPPSEVRRLFRPFERLQPGRRHHDNGHGLGLSIVAAIATAHGAAITAQSRSEGGLSIEITFPPWARRGAPLPTQKELVNMQQTPAAVLVPEALQCRAMASEDHAVLVGPSFPLSRSIE
jgi:signal transduction histidine kinase